MTRKVGTKGQVVIDKKLRDKLGIGPGWMVYQTVVDGHLEMHFFPPEHDRSLAGILASHAKGRIAEDADWAEMKAKAWAEAVDVTKFRPGWRDE